MYVPLRVGQLPIYHFKVCVLNQSLDNLPSGLAKVLEKEFRMNRTEGTSARTGGDNWRPGAYLPTYISAN